MLTLSLSAYQFSSPSQPTEISENMNEPSGMSGWMAPVVPILSIVRHRCSGLTSLVLKSTLASESSSVSTMSMLSVPMPVESTVMRLPLYFPVIDTNSLEAWRNSFSSRNSPTMSTLPGSPTSITLSASSSGLRCMWKADPSSLMISSDSGILISVTF